MYWCMYHFLLCYLTKYLKDLLKEGFTLPHSLRAQSVGQGVGMGGRTHGSKRLKQLLTSLQPPGSTERWRVLLAHLSSPSVESLSQISPEVRLLGNLRSCHADCVNCPSTLGQVSRRESIEINGEELRETRRAAAPRKELKPTLYSK